MNKISIIFPYYENPQMLARHVEEWKGWEQFSNDIEIILVDDYSANGPCKGSYINAIIKCAFPSDLPVRIFRMVEKLKWNQHGCRNFGATVAVHPWLFMCDMDHLISADGIKTMLTAPLPQGHYFVPNRQLTDGSLYHSNRNMFLMRKIDFEMTGGYDEDYCGHYGSDYQFLTRVEAWLKRLDLPIMLTMFKRNDIGDCNTSEWQRKTPEDVMAMEVIGRLKREYSLPVRRGRIKAKQVL